MKGRPRFPDTRLLATSCTTCGVVNMQFQISNVTLTGSLGTLMSSSSLCFRDYLHRKICCFGKVRGRLLRLSRVNQYMGFMGHEDRSHIVLDGQQRLTALYYAFIAPDVPAPNRRNRYLYFLHVDRFMEEDF